MAELLDDRPDFKAPSPNLRRPVATKFVQGGGITINRSIVCAALLATTLDSGCRLAQPLFLRKDIPVGVNPAADP